MISDSKCPENSDLKRFLYGDADEIELAGWEEHLTRCPKCQSRLSQVKEPDPLVEAFRVQARVDAPPEDEVVQRIIGRLLDLPQVATTSFHPFVFKDQSGTRSGDAEPTLGQAVERYEIVRELGRGGMGVVVMGYDRHMDRDLALKVLPEHYCDRPQQVQRLLNEARITGRLQHPGIVPVYDWGKLPDRRPYFTMKLVQGRTLAELLQERPDVTHDRPRLLAVFEQVCQAVAYAHSKGVLHRDLKPHNVMVGAFGEVQVMDWGLAKVLRRGQGWSAWPEGPETVDCDDAATAPGAACVDTPPGEIMGTPAYMSPEQARGEVETLDERCDVFGLGAILCHILTGQPPFVGTDLTEVLAGAGAANHAEALAQLDTCGAELDLVRLTKTCLSADPSGRPANASAVAASMTMYLEGVQERLRQAELGRAAAQAKVREERKHRRLALGLAAAVVSLAVVIGGAGAWFQQQQAELRRGTESALVTAAGLRDAARWNEAIDVLEQATNQLSAVAPADLQPRVAQARAEVTLARRLDDIRQKRATLVDGQFDDQAADQDYTLAFRSAGLWQDGEEEEVVADRIRQSPIQGNLIAALDDWANAHVGWSRRAWLLGVASRAGSDEWGVRFRDPKIWGKRDALQRLVDEAHMSALSPQLLTTVGLLLDAMGMDAVSWLAAAQSLHPNDFWLNYRLGIALRKAKKPAEAVGYYRAALAVRPDSVAAHITLGNALRDNRQLDEAIRSYRRAINLDPEVALAHNHLGLALAANGQLDEAIRSYRRAIEITPDYALAHGSLALALKDKGQRDEALREFRRANALAPGDVQGHNNLGMLLLEMGRPDEAISEFRKAVEIAPKLALAHSNLGFALWNKDLQEAVASFRKAMELDPKDVRTSSALGAALLQQGRFAEAIGPLRRCQELLPENHFRRKFATDLLQKHAREIALDEKLAVVLESGVQLTDAAECLGLASLCQRYKRLYVTAVRFYRDAFAAEPRLADDWQSQHRYRAAGSAVLAAKGQGDDARHLPNRVVVMLRQQALAWLRADVTLCAKLTEGDASAPKQMVRQWLAHWQQDPDLASVREKGQLDKLSDDEHRQWRVLWDEVAAVLARVGTPPP